MSLKPQKAQIGPDKDRSTGTHMHRDTHAHTCWVMVYTVGYDVDQEGAWLWGVRDRKGLDCDLLTFLINFMLE